MPADRFIALNGDLLSRDRPGVDVPHRHVGIRLEVHDIFAGRIHQVLDEQPHVRLVFLQNALDLMVDRGALFGVAARNRVGFHSQTLELGVVVRRHIAGLVARIVVARVEELDLIRVRREAFLPAEDERVVGLGAEGLVQQGLEVHGLEVDVDAQLEQRVLDDHTDRLTTGVPLVRDQRELKGRAIFSVHAALADADAVRANRPASLVEHLSGHIRIVRDGLEGRVIGPGGRDHVRSHLRALTEDNAFDDLRDVDGVLNRAADADVTEDRVDTLIDRVAVGIAARLRILRIGQVESHVVPRVAGEVFDDDTGRFAQVLATLNRRAFEIVGLAGQELLNKHSLVRNVRVDEARGDHRAFVPVSHRAGAHGFARDELRKLEGTIRHRRAGVEFVIDHYREVKVFAAIIAEDVRRNRAERANRAQRRAARLLEDRFDGVVIDDVDGADTQRVASRIVVQPPIQRGIDLATRHRVKRKLDVFRGQRLAIGPLGIITQGDRIDQAILRYIPVRRQRAEDTIFTDAGIVLSVRAGTDHRREQQIRIFVGRGVVVAQRVHRAEVGRATEVTFNDRAAFAWPLRQRHHGRHHYCGNRYKYNNRLFHAKDLLTQQALWN